MGDSAGATKPKLEPVPEANVRSLGATGIEVFPVGIGTWSWVDREGWEFGASHGESDLREVVAAAAVRGPVLFDTAEKYGNGDSERYLGRFLREHAARPVVATKFSPGRWDVRRRDLHRALRGSLDRLQLRGVDLYQVHWPSRFCRVEARMAAMAEAIDAGFAKAAGVSNYSLEQLLRADDALARRGLSLATVQVEFSLLHRAPEETGLLRACAERGMTLLAYSPLAMGVLTGKYAVTSPPPGERGRRYPPALLARLPALLEAMREVGAAHGGASVAQVALAWVCAKGALPLAGARNRRQAEENLDAARVRLRPAEVAALDEAAARVLGVSSESP